jgi:two-component system, LytTR family, response regulator LytT
MKILIIEDEEPSVKRLQKLLIEIIPNCIFVGSIESTSAAINWFNKNDLPDLIFSDIQLSDGTSFEIFKQINISCPIIFITAYDQYAIEAFKVNGIDYLLKPIKKDDLKKAIDKYNKLFATKPAAIDINKLLEGINPSSPIHYKQRFLVRYGEHIKTINIEEIAFFYTEDKINFITIKDGKRFIIDYNLDALEELLDPKKFFRINRQYIICITAIKEMLSYSKSRVLIKLQPEAKHENIVSTERSADFKIWLGDGK